MRAYRAKHRRGGYRVLRVTSSEACGPGGAGSLAEKRALVPRRTTGIKLLRPQVRDDWDA